MKCFPKRLRPQNNYPDHLDSYLMQLLIPCDWPDSVLSSLGSVYRNSKDNSDDHLGLYVTDPTFCSGIILIFSNHPGVFLGFHDSQLANVQRVRESEIAISHPSPKAQGSSWRTAWKDFKNQLWMITPRKQYFFQTQGTCIYEITVMVTLPQTRAQDQATTIPAWIGEGSVEFVPCLKSYWQLAAARRGRFSLLHGCIPWDTTHAPAPGPTPMQPQAAPSELNLKVMSRQSRDAQVMLGKKEELNRKEMWIWSNTL